MFEKGYIRAFRVKHSFVWRIGKKTSDWVLTVPAGTEFESSVPKFLQWFLDPSDPKFLKAAAVHDTLLESGYTRAFADSQWLEVNLSEYAPKLKTRLAYLGMTVSRVFSYVKQ